jgi:hypothetical protein
MMSRIGEFVRREWKKNRGPTQPRKVFNHTLGILERLGYKEKTGCSKFRTVKPQKGGIRNSYIAED